LAKDYLCKAIISRVACLGLYQKKISRSQYEVIENLLLEAGSRRLRTLELEIFPRGTC
jgi:hypothetical protein